MEFCTYIFLVLCNWVCWFWCGFSCLGHGMLTCSLSMRYDIYIWVIYIIIYVYLFLFLFLFFLVVDVLLRINYCNGMSWGWVGFERLKIWWVLQGLVDVEFGIVVDSRWGLVGLQQIWWMILIWFNLDPSFVFALFWDS